MKWNPTWKSKMAFITNYTENDGNLLRGRFATDRIIRAAFPPDSRGAYSGLCSLLESIPRYSGKRSVCPIACIHRTNLIEEKDWFIEFNLICIIIPLATCFKEECDLSIQ